MAGRTGPLDERDRAEIIEGLRRGYRAAGRRWHGRVAWVGSPQRFRPYEHLPDRFARMPAAGRRRERAWRLLSIAVETAFGATAFSLLWLLAVVLAHQEAMGVFSVLFTGPSGWFAFGLCLVWGLGWFLSATSDGPRIWADDRIALRTGGDAWRGYHALFRQFGPHVLGNSCPATSGDCLRLGWPGRAFACATFRNLAVVIEPPTTVHAETLPDGTSRPHCDHGPALEWPGGERYFFLHGTLVPEDLFRGEWDVGRIHGTSNSELRRLAIERMGWETYIAAAGLEPVAEAPDPANPGAVLRLFDIPGADGRVLLMRNGSPDRSGGLRHYAEPVPRTMDDPVEAAAWQYGCPPEVYRRLQRRT